MINLRSAWNFAKRDLRGSFKNFSIFLMSLGLGVCVITAVETLSVAVKNGLKADANLLLGGDVELRLVQRPASKDQLQFLKFHSESLSKTVEMRAMAIPFLNSVRPSLISLKAIDAHYPLYGKLKTTPLLNQNNFLQKKANIWGAIIDPILIKKLNIKLGSRIKIGNAIFEIRGTIAREPDKAASFIQFGPRVMIPINAINETGLILPGSQIKYFYRVLLKPDDTVRKFKERVNTVHPNAGWRMRDTSDAVPGIKRFVERLTLFLNFVGLTILLVGGVGVSVAVRAYLATKTRTIATLKCLGAPSQLICSVYLIQVLIMAGIAILLGLVIGWFLPQAAISVLEPILPIKPISGFYLPPLARASAFGLITAISFALWPLGQSQAIKPTQLFQNQDIPLAALPPRTYIVSILFGAIFLVLIIVSGTTETHFSWWFIIGVISTFIILNFAATTIQFLAKKIHCTKPILRIGITNLYRPNSTIRTVMLSLGLGLSVLISVVLIQRNLTKVIVDRQPGDAPAFFFIDIQPSQIVEFDKVIKTLGKGSHLEKAASIRGRIVRIANILVKDAEIAPESQWAVRGDRALTYAAVPSAKTEIVKGKWWSKDYSGRPLISLDSGLAQGFGVDVGDTITFNILGQEITATIANLREIDWKTLRFNFAIIFAPGTLEDAPHSYLAAVHTSSSAELEIEQAITEKFSNISVIRVREALEEAARIIEGIGWAMNGLALVTVLAGILVLAGTFATTQIQRVRDATILKVFGATRSQVIAIYLLESGFLGLITSIISAAIGVITSWALIVFLFHLTWQWFPGDIFLTIGFVVLFTTSFGVLSTWKALGKKVSPYLRNS